jgi:hypothetical protein
MTEEELQEWDQALRDLVKKGLAKVVHKNGEIVGFTFLPNPENIDFLLSNSSLPKT